MNSFLIAGMLAVGTAALMAGCSGSRPVAPSVVTTTDVEIPMNDSIRGSLLSSSSTEILYAVRDKGGLKKKGKIGPFSGEAVPTGALNISFQVALGEDAVLSVQVNEADTNKPLALGAAALDFGEGDIRERGVSASAVGYGGKTSVPMDLGSLVGNCSYFDYNYAWEYLSFSIGQRATSIFGYQDVYLYEHYVNDVPQGIVMESDPADEPHIAYLGNGDMVDFAYLPPDSQFHLDSMQAKQAKGAGPYLATGDVFCVKQNYDGGHAWVQVSLRENDGTQIALRYRTNWFQPFYGWAQSSCYNW